MVKAIFCISPGRSGSHYLSGLLAESKNCESHHEAKPNGFGKPLQLFHRGDTGLMSEVAGHVADAVNEAASRNLVYAETSHCFIKGFGWPLMEHLDQSQVGVVVLKRDKEAVVNSTIRALSVPLRNLGRSYILTPERVSPIIPPPSFCGLPGAVGYATARALHQTIMKFRRLGKKLGLPFGDVVLFPAYQRKAVAWYWDETYALCGEFRKKYPDCKYFETTTEDLNCTQKVSKLFDFFGLEPAQSLTEKVGVPTNLKL